MKDSALDSEITSSLTSIIPKRFSVQKMKWFALSFLTLSIMGPIYSFAFLQPLETQIETLFGINDEQYNLLYTLGGIPAIFMPILGGYLTDYLGARTTFLATLVISIISQIVMAYACHIVSFNLLIIGSLIFNCIFDTFYLARVKLIMTMFYNRHMPLAVGVAVVTEKLTMFASNIITPWVYDNVNSLERAWWYLPVAISILAFILGVIFVSLDKSFGLTEELVPSDDTPKGGMKLSDLRKLNKLVWLFMLTACFSYSGYIGLLDNVNALLERSYNFSTQGAGDMASSYTIVSMIMTPILSYAIEKTNKRMYAIIGFAVSINLVFMTFLLFPDCDQCYIPLVPLSLIGCFDASYILSCCSVPAYLIQKELIGTSMGVSCVLINTMGTISPYLFGLIMDNTTVNGEYDYTWIFILLQGLSVVGLMLAFVTRHYDAKMGYPLSVKRPEENKRIWIY